MIMIRWPALVNVRMISVFILIQSWILRRESPFQRHLCRIPTPRHLGNLESIWLHFLLPQRLLHRVVLDRRAWLNLLLPHRVLHCLVLDWRDKVCWWLRISVTKADARLGSHTICAERSIACWTRTVAVLSVPSLHAGLSRVVRRDVSRCRGWSAALEVLQF